MSRQPGDPNLKLADLMRFLRCATLAALFGLACIIGIFWLAGRYDQEWAAARPKGLTDEQWQARRTLCDEAKLSASQCGSMPIGDIKAAADKEEAAARAELCFEEKSGEAIEKAKEAVAERLKAPSTARWSAIVTAHDGCDWRVTGAVDAQNAFGAMMRSTFEVRLTRVSPHTWVPLSVKVG